MTTFDMPRQEPLFDAENLNHPEPEIAAAAHRVVQETDVEQPAPPSPYETDAHISSRHREVQEAKFRQAAKEPPVNPELDRKMLERFAKGDFTMPPTEEK